MHRHPVEPERLGPPGLPARPDPHQLVPSLQPQRALDLVHAQRLRKGEWGGGGEEVEGEWVWERARKRKRKW